MSTITKRQSYWRDHVLAAATFDGTIVQYATLHNLKPKDINQWKTALTKRGLLPMAEHEATDFFTVKPAERTNSIEPDISATVQCRLTPPCGSVLEFIAAVEPVALSR